MVFLISKHEANNSVSKLVSGALDNAKRHMNKALQPLTCSAKNIEPKPRARYSDHKAAHVPDVANGLGAHERQEHKICLLPLKLVDSLDRFGRADQRMPSAFCSDDIFDECLLAIVRRKNDDLVGAIPEQAHVHERCYNVLCFAQILEEIRAWFLLPLAHKVADIHKLGSLQTNVTCHEHSSGQTKQAPTLANPALATWKAGDEATCGMSSKFS